MQIDIYLGAQRLLAFCEPWVTPTRWCWLAERVLSTPELAECAELDFAQGPAQAQQQTALREGICLQG